MRHIVRPWGLACFVTSFACSSGAGLRPFDLPGDDAAGAVPGDVDRPTGDSASPAGDSAVPSGDTALTLPGDAATLPDAAELVEATPLTSLPCNSTFVAGVLMRNIGTTTWVTNQYNFGTADPADAFLGLSSNMRGGTWEGTDVPPGGVGRYFFRLDAPSTAGVYTTQRRMVHEGVTWFGPEVRWTIDVTCSGNPPPCGDQIDWRQNNDQVGYAEASQFYDELENAVDWLTTNEATIFDLNDYLGGRAYLIVRPDHYLNGVVERLKAQGLCAMVDPNAFDEITVKLDDSYSENFDIMTWNGYSRAGSGSYTTTCRPSWF